MGAKLIAVKLMTTANKATTVPSYDFGIVVGIHDSSDNVILTPAYFAAGCSNVYTLIFRNGSYTTERVIKSTNSTSITPNTYIVTVALFKLS